MAPSFDCALLCGEVDCSIFSDDLDYEPEPNFRVYECNYSDNQKPRTDWDELFVDCLLLSEEGLDVMIRRECEHLPSGDYLSRFENGDLDLGARRDAVDWIGKVQAHFNFGPLCAYLAVNYFDRFLSASSYELLKGKAWSMQLLAVACLSIAAKMEETVVPLCLDLQVGGPKFVFEARTILKMELIVLSTLEWRMQVISPFSFIYYFLQKINGDEAPPRSSLYLSTQFILSIIKEIDYLKFRPSEIAAAVAVSVKGETQAVETEKSISLLSQPVIKERVFECVELLQKLSVICWPLNIPSTVNPSLPRSPIGVIDAASLSYKTVDHAVGSGSTSTHSSPHT